MSWPKIGGIYPFMRHLGPFGCIQTAIFSENANLSKTRFQEKNHTIGSTDHQVQFLNGFAIFHTPQGTQGVWKIAKKSNHIAKFCCGSVRKLPYFFQKIRYFFWKNCKKYKKKLRKLGLMGPHNTFFRKKTSNVRITVHLDISLCRAQRKQVQQSIWQIWNLIFTSFHVKII